jgi:hypothetical protein
MWISDMGWTDLIVEPLKVTMIYGRAPGLSRFALDDLVLAGGNVTMRGDFGQLPAPLPRRWAERGYTRAHAKFQALMSLAEYVRAAHVRS